MKRIMAVMLVLSMLFTFSACSAEEEKEKIMKTDIIGEWMAVSVDASAVFHEDGTGELQYNGKQSITWKYDPDTDKYVVIGDQTYNASVGKDYDMPYLSVMGIDFYLMYDYNDAYTLLLSRYMENVFNLTDGMTKIKLNTRYSLTEDVFIEFTEIFRQVSGDVLVASYEITNYRSETVNEPICAEVFGSCYVADRPSALSLHSMVEFEYPIESGETVVGTVTLCELADVAQLTIDKFGMVIGAVYFSMFGQQYFVELEEFFN